MGTCILSCGLSKALLSAHLSLSYTIRMASQRESAIIVQSLSTPLSQPNKCRDTHSDIDVSCNLKFSFMTQVARPLIKTAFQTQTHTIKEIQTNRCRQAYTQSYLHSLKNLIMYKNVCSPNVPPPKSNLFPAGDRQSA